ncbi:MAG: NTP transferase domain-containing protein [Tabrizicola sp.]|nr:NTP transferase domain-containing protein [Tabrizicola sp.]
MIDAVALSKTVAIVLAGGQGSRLHELTARECKPALPFARAHRIVDFAMAGLVRSGLSRIIVATQYRPQTLTTHLGSTWAPALPDHALSLRHGPAVAGDGGYLGTADVLRANTALLDEMGARELLIVAADHIYAMDFRPLLASHKTGGAAVTVAAMPVPAAEASRFGILTVGAGGAGGEIADFAEKPLTPATIPDDPSHALASLGIYVIDWTWLKGLLHDPRVQDFGHDVIPAAVLSGDAAAWEWRGYWRDVGTLDSLRESWLDFDAPNTPCPLPVLPGMPMPVPEPGLMRARFRARSNLGGMQLLSPPGGSSATRRWAALDRSILMPGARIGPGVRLTNVIVAPGTVIAGGMRIGEDPAEDARWFRQSGDTTLVSSAMLFRRGALRPRSYPLFSTRIGAARSGMRTT